MMMNTPLNPNATPIFQCFCLPSKPIYRAGHRHDDFDDDWNDDDDWDKDDWDDDGRNKDDSWDSDKNSDDMPSSIKAAIINFFS